MTRSRARGAHVDPELAAVNFADFEQLYFEQTGAPHAASEFERIRTRTSRRRLRTLLRNHTCRQIVSGAEIALRDAFDDLLAYYAILEIASSLGYVGELPEEARRQAVDILGDEDVQAYYRTHYPLLLPQLLLQRAAGQRTFVLAPESVDLAAFMRFLDLNSTIEHSDDADVFLAMLDDYTYRDGESYYGIGDVLAVLGRPREFARRLARPVNRRDLLDTGLHGFRIFLRFCRGLDELLVSLERSPIQQSLLWHHHAYWFEIVRDDVGGHLHAALRQFAQWEGDVGNGAGRAEVGDDRSGDPRSLASMHAALRRLTSGRYGWALRENTDADGTAAS